jgi:beta-lactamase class D
MAKTGIRLCLSVVAGVFAVAPLAAEVVLTTELGPAGPALTLVEGSEAEAELAVPMASTFKVFLAWVALEEKRATAETLLPVRDRQVPSSPRSITLHQAMFYSSNDYFVGLFDKDLRGVLEGYLLKSGLVDEIPSGWLAGDPKEIAWGGKLKVSPQRNHRFMIRVAAGSLTSSPDIQQALERVCRWPSEEGDAQVYGKTGTYAGAVWFNGFGRTPATGRTTVRTVYLPGGVAERARAIEGFYQGFGLRWQPQWQRWLETAKN